MQQPKKQLDDANSQVAVVQKQISVANAQLQTLNQQIASNERANFYSKQSDFK
jgi:prefoldin subunit 5